MTVKQLIGAGLVGASAIALMVHRLNREQPFRASESVAAVAKAPVRRAKRPRVANRPHTPIHEEATQTALG